MTKVDNEEEAPCGTRSSPLPVLMPLLGLGLPATTAGLYDIANSFLLFYIERFKSVDMQGI